MAMAHIVDNNIIGVFEFYLREEWYEVPQLVEKVRFYLQN
jgi:hypothetical protein